MSIAHAWASGAPDPDRLPTRARLGLKCLWSLLGLMNGSDCLGCWAFRFCNVCYASFDDQGALTQASKARGCESLRATMTENLAAYCHALENNAHAWDYMDHITVK